MDTIHFYRASDEYGYFSNFSRHRIFLKDKLWPTTEHYFQAQKFAGTKHEDEVRLAKTPKEAASMGRDRSRPLRPDWEQVKIDIMKEALMAKFTQQKQLKLHLLASNDAKLVEHTANDFYWGDGLDGSGKNMLGILLMSVRDEIRKSSASTTSLPPQDQQIIEKMQEEDNVEEEDIKQEETEQDVVGSSSGSGSSDGDDDESVDANGASNSTSSSKKVKKSRHDQMMKKATSGRKKARSKRGVFLDAQGESIIEKSKTGTKGVVDIVGKDGKKVVAFPSEVLPSNAKTVLHRNQFRQRGKPTEDDFEDDEEDEEVEEEFVDSHRTTANMSDYFPAELQSKSNDDAVMEEYLLNPSLCIEASKNTVELLRSLPKDDPSSSDLVRKCKQLKDVIQGFIEGDILPEMDQLLLQFESLSQVLSEM